MSRLTLRLPETLHSLLIDLAQREGVSLNQYIVYALTRQSTLASSPKELVEDLALKQRSSFEGLLESLGKVSLAEAREILKEREVVEPEEGLAPAVVQRLQQRIRDRAAELSHGSDER